MKFLFVLAQLRATVAQLRAMA